MASVQDIFTGLALTFVSFSTWKLVACWTQVCNCLLTLGGSIVKREICSNGHNLMNHVPAAKGHVIDSAFCFGGGEISHLSYQVGTE